MDSKNTSEIIQREEKKEEKKDEAPFPYMCGSCGRDVFLKKGDPIKCKSCGYRILFKKRKMRGIYYAV
jgi:DNA-directed RNA polymerase subunit RPC12/RpoP